MPELTIHSPDAQPELNPAPANGLGSFEARAAKELGLQFDDLDLSSLQGQAEAAQQLDQMASEQISAARDTKEPLPENLARANVLMQLQQAKASITNLKYLLAKTEGSRSQPNAKSALEFCPYTWWNRALGVFT